MAKVLSPPQDRDLYEDDFALWADLQSDLLRSRRFDELDLDHLIEEVEDLGRRERDMVESYLETVLEHLLKLSLSTAQRPRRGWLVTVDRRRAKLGRKLTTTLRNHLQQELPAIYAGLRRPVARQLEKEGVSLDALPAACPWTLDQVLDPDWLPANRNGIQEKG